MAPRPREPWRSTARPSRRCDAEAPSGRIYSESSWSTPPVGGWLQAWVATVGRSAHPTAPFTQRQTRHRLHAGRPVARFDDRVRHDDHRRTRRARRYIASSTARWISRARRESTASRDTWNTRVVNEARPSRRRPPDAQPHVGTRRSVHVQNRGRPSLRPGGARLPRPERLPRRRRRAKIGCGAPFQIVQEPKRESHNAVVVDQSSRDSREGRRLSECGDGLVVEASRRLSASDPRLRS